jgi:HD-GYP domain-containing protein (c-di-GMP phosphodiesterase class II)
LENSTLIEDLSSAVSELETAYEATITGWSKALELKDKETQGHSDRVTRHADILAQKAGFPEEKMTDFRRGVLLHDIGKMGIPDSILLKDGPLTQEDWAIMKEHPKYAYDLLSNIPYLKDALEIPYGHHERWNGSGYPQGLKGEEIPLAARIFAVVDVWDALREIRLYKPAWEPERVRNYLIENKEILFDPNLVDLFLEIIDEDIQ